MTGNELYQWWRQHNDLAYSGDPGSAKVNRIFKRAFTNVIESIYRDRLRDQNSYDQIRDLICTSKPFALAFNKLHISPIQIQSLSAAGGVVATIVFERRHYLETSAGVSVTFSGIVSDGTALPPGTASVTTLNGQTFSGAVLNIVNQTTIQITNGTPFGDNGAANTGVVVSYIGGVKSCVDDYDHLLTLKAQMKKLYSGLEIDEASNASPVKLTFSARNRFRSEDMIYIESATGNTAINGTYFIKELGPYKSELYIDSSLLNPVVGTGTYTGDAVVYEVVSEYTKQKNSDEKISVSGQPTLRNPYHEISEHVITVLPETISCSSVELDYVRKPDVYIDVTDTVVDLERWYPINFLYSVAAEAGKLYARMYRDGEGNMLNQSEIVENP